MFPTQTHSKQRVHTPKGHLHTFHVHPKHVKSHVCDTPESPDILAYDHTHPHSRVRHRKHPEFGLLKTRISNHQTAN